jgi:chromosome transmission fidelity protein 18
MKTGIFANLPSTRPFTKSAYQIVTCSGKSAPVPIRETTTNESYESMVAARSKTKEGRAKRSYYGIDIHELVSNANKELAETRQTAPVTPPANADQPVLSVENHGKGAKKHKKSLLWTEKYRARNFADLVGDDLTNRQVLRWLKRWDPVVFPHVSKKAPVVRRPAPKDGQQPAEEKPLRKILMLTGPPGLGKTTLAHVCARQAGYEVLEINASDDRSSAVVKGRIRTSLGTESVKTVEHKKLDGGGAKFKVARPVCVVVDEVDGVVTGSGSSGEGGFVKALIDLVLTDQKNSAVGNANASRKKKKGDDFRQMRPLVLICNDVYAPALRPLRQSGLAEVIHVGKPSMDAVVVRLKTVFEKEGIPCDKDAARKLCEAAWGMTSGIDAKRGAEGNVEGDLRGIMVVGEMVASRLKAASPGGPLHLTRQWVEKNIMHSLAHGGGGARGLGRGGSKEIVTRIFQEGAGFPKQSLAASSSKNLRHEQPQTELSFSEQQKKYGALRLAEMVETCGEIDRIVTDVFLEYPNREYNDDSFLTKPDTAYEWLHFHDTCSTRLFAGQEWELGPYLSQPVLACHNLFASPKRHMPAQDRQQWGDVDEAEAPPVPFSSSRADFEAREAEKVNRAILQGIQASLPPSLHRAFRSPEHVAADFLPYLVRLVSPDVKPVLVGGGGDKFPVASVRRESERTMVRRAARVLAEVGIQLLKGRIEAEGGGPVGRPTWVYRMEP